VASVSRLTWNHKPIRLVLSWLTNRDLTDADLAAALDTTPPTYSRHKDDDDFPSFEELGVLGEHFGVSPTVLQIAFGHRAPEEVVLLSGPELRQYLELGGANHMPGEFQSGLIHWRGLPEQWCDMGTDGSEHVGG